MSTEKSINEAKGNAVLPCVSISFIHNLITKYEDKIKFAENLKAQGGSTWGSESPTKADKERLDIRIYERKTFIEDLRSLLNGC